MPSIHRVFKINVVPNILFFVSSNDPIEDNLSAQEASVIDIRALIMSPAFENAARFYQMFSTDVTYYGDQILVEGKKISRVTMSSVVDLLNALKKQLLAGEKHFLIACHGSPEGLLIRAAPGHTTTLTDKILDRLLAAADDETGARDTLLGTTDKSGKKLFTKESQVDDLLSLIKDVRGGQIELIEFRCCNLGAGAGLKKDPQAVPRQPNDRRQAKVRAPALLWCSRSRPDNHSASHRTHHKIPRSAGARGSPQKFEGMRAIHCPEWHLSPSCLASGP
jgi:hypothetical protein